MKKNYEQIVSNGSHRSVGSQGSVGSFSDHESDENVIDLQAADKSVHEDDDNDQEEHSPLKGDLTESVSSSSASQPLAYSPVSRMRASSFTFDDEDDEDEENLKRYNLDFSIDADRAKLTTSPGGTTTSSHSSTQQNFSTVLQSLWYSFQTQRQQARQRRAQLLLQQSERDLRQSVWICVSTYCDATDRGILLVAALIFLWIVLLLSVSHGDFRRHLFVTGFLLFAVRLGARPLWGYFSRQRQRRRLQSHDRQSHQALPTQSPGPKQLRQRVNEYDDNPKGRYLDEPPQSENLELQSIP
jgi:hypothetical protein